MTKDCAYYYRLIVVSPVKTTTMGCEMCGADSALQWAVHHPLGRSAPYRFDVRNGIFLCDECHRKYDHALPLLLADMRAKGGELALQADWLERHEHDKDARVGEKRKNHELPELRAMLKAIERGDKTRADFRDWEAD